MKVFPDSGDALTYAIFVLLPFMSGALLVWLARCSMRAGSRNKGRVVAAANLLVFVLAVSTVMVAMESYYRFWCDTTDSFALTRVTQSWLQRHWKLNSSGFRDSLSAYPASRTSGQRRITFIGDSFTAGYGVANVEDRFANRIRNGGESEVHVMAKLGFDTADEIELVRALAAQHYQFDEVVLVYNLNDLSDIDPEWQAVDRRINSTNSPGFLVEHSFLFNTYYYHLKARFEPDIANYYQSVRKAYDGPVWEEQQRRLRSLRSLVETNGGHLLVVTFPFLQHLGPDYEFRSAHVKLDKFWQEQGVPHLDLLRLYEAHRHQSFTVNSHDAHPNANAHALATDAIWKFLKTNSRNADHR
jgi:lysophospholipase L1-like esterase